jgi:hypothetical protein
MILSKNITGDLAGEKNYMAVAKPILLKTLVKDMVAKKLC